MARLGKGDNNKFKSMNKRLMAMREPVVEQCDGCDKVDIKDFCKVYIKPESTWRRGKCPVASHLEEEEKTKKHVRVGQQKQKSFKT